MSPGIVHNPDNCARNVLSLFTEKETEAQSSQAVRNVQSAKGKRRSGPTSHLLLPQFSSSVRKQNQRDIVAS